MEMETPQPAAAAKRRKAFGHDAIPADALAVFAPQMAKACLPLFVKADLRCQEPFQWKGVQNFPLFKGSGLPTQLANHRAIALGGSLAKAHHSLWRRRLQSHVDFRLQTQHGGFPNQGSDFPAHKARLWLRRSQWTRVG